MRVRPRRRIYWRQQDPGRSPGNGTENPAGRRTCPCPCEWKQLSGQPAAHPVSSWAVFREDNKDLNVISPGCGLFVPDRNNYSFFFVLFCREIMSHRCQNTWGFFFLIHLHLTFNRFAIKMHFNSSFSYLTSWSQFHLWRLFSESCDNW